MNHQSCEACADTARHELIAQFGLVAYHRQICEEMGVDPDRTALMGTAANMAYVAHHWADYEEVHVDAFVTAGISGNAARAGDPAQWLETDSGWSKCSFYEGTINTILLFNCPVTPSAHASAVVTMTEAKSAALAELAIHSLYSPTIATGTGTDQFCLAAPLYPTQKPKGSTSPHLKLGELIGVAVKEAVKESLRWQNGLESSYTRSLFHTLRCFGLTEQHALGALAKLLSEQEYALLDKNQKAIFYEPGVAVDAYEFAAVLDRVAFGKLPRGQAKESLRQQAACLACCL